MITTIREQLDRSGVPVQDTAFSACSDAVLDFQLSTVPFLEWQQQPDRMALIQKNMVEAVPLTEAEQALGMALPGLPREMPWFCAGLEDVRDAMRCGRPIAVEGGPCLFGVDEVLAEVTLRDGSAHVFDESTGRYMDTAHAYALPDFLLTHAGEITAVRFINQKRGVTSQERDSIEWLFRIAQPLGARVVLPLPDMSYGKYMTAITEPLAPEVAQAARSAFDEVTSAIAQLYIQLTEQIGGQYPDVTYSIVHGGDTALCERYYEARAPHIERHKILRNITNVPGKLESIKDYISMPALPYYLYGITDILQVDSLDEVDSYRKCLRAHRSVLKLACLLYPERLSADGVNTIFQTTQAYKEYL